MNRRISVAGWLAGLRGRTPQRDRTPRPTSLPRALGWLAGAGVTLAVLMLALFLVGQGSVCLVFSDSMAPTLRTGDVILLQPLDPAAVRPGMIVSYWWDDKLITHRVLSIQDGIMSTQGDAIAQPDPWTAPVTSVTGAPFFRVPLVGYPLLFLRQPAGWVLVIVLPALALVAWLARDTLALLRKGAPA